MRVRLMLFTAYCILFLLANSSEGQTWEQLYKSADSLYNLSSMSDISRSVAVAKKALESVEQKFGKTDTNIARVLDLCAELVYDVDEQPKEALSYAERSLAIKERLLGPNHISVAKTLDILASLYGSTGREDVVNPMRTRALSIYESTHAPESADYASLLHNMAPSYQAVGKFDSAAIMYARALAMMRRVLPPGDRNLAYTLTMLGTNYLVQGFYAEAEELLKEALQNWKDFFGPESGLTAFCMGNLAGLYESQGKLAQSEYLVRSALEFRKREFGSEDQKLGRWYQGLGEILRMQGKYDEAIDTLKRAIAIWDAAKKPEERSASVTRLIGECHLAQHNYDQAKCYFLRALELQDSLFKYDVESKTTTLLWLAKTFARTGNSREADSLFAYSLQSREQLLGSDNPDVAEVLEAYSDCYRLNGDFSKALEASYRAVGIRSKNFLRNARMMAEKDALTFSMFLRRSVNNYLSSVIDSRSSDAQISKQVANIITSTKGQTTEQAITRRKALVTETDSATLALAEEYRYTRFQLSTLYVEGPAKKKPEQFRSQVDSLENAANDLEASLARKSQSFAGTQHEQNVSIDDVISHLPSSSLLVEYLKVNYVKLSPDTLIPHYLALTADAVGQLRVVDLGEAERIDKTIENYRNHFATLATRGKPVGRNEEKAYNAVASQLYELIWKPIEKAIKQRGTVFIAPDGGLNLVSFAGLLGKDGKYLIEEYPIQYLSAGRDVLRLEENESSATGLIAFADPDFDATVTERLSSVQQIATNPGIDNPYQVRNVRSGCELLNEMTVPRLYNTRSEVESIARFWREHNSTGLSECLVGPKASEETFKHESPGNRVIHLATHGYFLQSSCMPTTNDNAVGENPLLQSGLVLAGANLHGKGAKETGADDGIVTALEVSAMDLKGTDLVVLSACETGLGKVEQGEGVYGLRRAFQMAGAKTVVSSLWQVPDKETAKFMKELYARMRKPRHGERSRTMTQVRGSRFDATQREEMTFPELMRKVALERIAELRDRGRPTHPYTWGGFVATGDWRIK